jgi:putative colanic acid biosynthesis glycosyltransferase
MTSNNLESIYQEEDKPLITIITVVRNAKALLEETIISVVSQTYVHTEYIIIDGSSSDGTLDIIEKYAGRIGFWISENDAGIYDAMNKGIENSTGDYLIFMNAGDKFFDSNVLQNFVSALLSKSKIDFIYGDSIELDSRNNTYYRKSRSHRFIWYGMFAHHQAMFFSKKSVGNIRYRQQFTIAGDYAFVSDILFKHSGISVIRLPFPVCYFRQGGVSFSEDGMSIAYKELREIRKNILRLNDSLIFFIECIQRFMNLLRQKFPSIYYYFGYNVKSNNS